VRETRGVVAQVDDDAILEAKAVIDRAGIGCEPASAASLAGARKLVQDGIISPTERVVAILTGHTLKDTETTVTYHTGANRYANRPRVVDADFASVQAALESHLAGTYPGTA
jgi:threonine synthase